MGAHKPKVLLFRRNIKKKNGAAASTCSSPDNFSPFSILPEREKSLPYIIHSDEQAHPHQHGPVLLNIGRHR